MVARDWVRYLLLRWTRNETPQLSMKRILYIASWIEPNGWVIGSAHYLSFVINVCCCNKRLGLSVVRGTNGFELLYNGRQNTQSHRMHDKAVNEQTNSIVLLIKASLLTTGLMARLKKELGINLSTSFVKFTCAIFIRQLLRCKGIDLSQNSIK